jgi:hypothetical protein
VYLYLTSYDSDVLDLPSSDVGKTRPHTTESVGSATMVVEAGPSSVVKHECGKPLKSGQRMFVLNILTN